MHISFLPDIINGERTLSESESKHLIRVLRKKNDDLFQIIDGIGGVYTVKITDDNPKQCAFEIVSQVDNYLQKNYNLHIAIAPTKNNDRLEWFLEKATEIGIDTITPIICDHSERTKIKDERLHKIIISAMKQSKQAYLPKLNPLVSFEKFIEDADGNASKFIAHCEENKKETLFHQQDLSNAIILIGPEGDFSKNEIETAIKSDFKPVSLGESRLRTETAGIVACTIVQLHNNK